RAEGRDSIASKGSGGEPELPEKTCSVPPVPSIAHFKSVVRCAAGLLIDSLGRHFGCRRAHSSSTTRTPKTFAMYISVTGLVLKSIWQMPRFQYLTVCAFRDAKASVGNVRTSLLTRGNVYHTVTVWESKEEMRRFYVGDAHRQAMMATKEVASYVKIHGFDCKEMPSDDECLELWREGGRVVCGRPQERHGDSIVEKAKEINPLGVEGSNICHS
ncbi:hypothetical protein THAOC_24643, partial [Thalassiosira oceanica]